MKESSSGEREERDQKKSSGPSRRGFLTGLLVGAVAAPVAIGAIGEAFLRKDDFSLWLKEREERMRFDRWSGLSPQGREAAIEQEVETVGSFIRSREGKRILESGSDQEIMRILTALPPILREHIRGTKYDVPRDQWPSVAIGRDFSAGVPQTRELSDPNGVESFYCGNGVYVGERTFLTNYHVLETAMTAWANDKSFGPAARSMVQHIVETYNNEQLDIVAVELSESPAGKVEKHPRILSLGASMTDADVQGRLIRVAGIRPHDGLDSDTDGTKVYPSIALRITPRLEEFIMKYGKYPREGFIENSFLYLTPPGETLMRDSSATGSRLADRLTEQDLGNYKFSFGMGTSGSPVLMGNDLVGIHHRGMTIEYNGESMEFGSFHGPDEIKKAIKLGMVYDTKKLPELPAILSGTTDSAGYYESSSDTDTYENNSDSE